jgi:hypothetical protein
MTVRTTAPPAETTSVPPVPTVSAPAAEIVLSPGTATEDAATGNETALTDTSTCLNCGCARVTKFCPECGQQAASPIQPMRDLVLDAAGEFFKFDSKLFVTLKSLLFRPGFLTNEYLAGRRAPYIAPLRLYLWVSAFYFVLFAMGPQKQLAMQFQNSGKVSVSTAAAPADAKPGQVSVSSVSAPQTPASAATTASSSTSSAGRRQENRAQRALRRVGEGGRWFSNNISTIMMFLIPVNALFLMGLFRGARRLYIEHLITLLHIQSFGMLAAMPFIWTGSLFVNQALSLVLNSVYAFFAMRAVYRQSVPLTLLKVVLYTLAYFVFSMLLGIVATIAFIFLPG